MQNFTPPNKDALKELKDIKPPVEIPDYSPIYLASVSILALALIIALIFIALKLLKKDKNRDFKKFCLERLKEVDLNSPKEAAYTITKYGHHLIKESKSKEVYTELLKRLKKYKYKKDVPSLDKETKEYYTLFIETLDGEIK